MCIQTDKPTDEHREVTIPISGLLINKFIKDYDKNDGEGINSHMGEKGSTSRGFHHHKMAGGTLAALVNN